MFLYPMSRSQPASPYWPPGWAESACCVGSVADGVDCDDRSDCCGGVSNLRPFQWAGPGDPGHWMTAKGYNVLNRRLQPASSAASSAGGARASSREPEEAAISPGFAARLRQSVLGLSPGEADFDRRGFSAPDE